MTVTGLVSALAIGMIVGALGRLVIPGRRSIPLWLTLVVGVVAALLGAVTARLAGLDAGRFGLLELLIQVGVAGAAVVLVVATTPHDRAGSR